MVPPDMVSPNMVAPNTVAPNSRFNFFGHIHKFKVRTLVESVASLHSLLASIRTLVESVASLHSLLASKILKFSGGSGKVKL